MRERERERKRREKKEEKRGRRRGEERQENAMKTKTQDFEAYTILIRQEDSFESI